MKPFCLPVKFKGFPLKGFRPSSKQRGDILCVAHMLNTNTHQTVADQQVVVEDKEYLHDDGSLADMAVSARLSWETTLICVTRPCFLTKQRPRDNKPLFYVFMGLKVVCNESFLSNRADRTAPLSRRSTVHSQPRVGSIPNHQTLMAFLLFLSGLMGRNQSLGLLEGVLGEL